MTAQEYLESTKRNNTLMESYSREKKKLEELAVKITVSSMNDLSREQNTKSNETIDKIIEMQIELDHEIDKLVKISRDVNNTISNIENPNERILLSLRYLEHKKWDEIAETMFCSSRQVFRIHKKALRSFEKVYEGITGNKLDTLK